jgi:sugar lactone lactonase YvrE
MNLGEWGFVLVRVVPGCVARRLPARTALAAVLALVSCLLTPAASALAGVPGGGTQRWNATYDAGSPAFSYAVAVSPDGSTVFSTGTTNYGTTAPGHEATVAVDAATGQEKWADVYRSSSNTGQRDRGTRIAVSPDGSKVFVTGEGQCPSGCGGGGFFGYSTIAYDASTGQRLWSTPYAEDGPGAYSIVVSPDGSKVFVNGGSGSFGTATVAYDASTGSQLYVIQNTGSLVPWKALAVSPDSSTVYVATTDGGQCGFQFEAYDSSDGTPRWTAAYPDCGLDQNLAIALSLDGSTLYAAGYGNSGFATVAYDASTGGQLWASVTNQLRFNGDSEPSVAVSPDGTKVFALGYADCTPSCSDQALVTVGYDASSGSQLWISRYKSGARNYPLDLAVSGDGSQVFVTGQEEMPCYSPCTTTQVNAPLVAYDPGTGTEDWVTDYQNNSSFALAASPDGSNVYVAGTFTTESSASAHVSKTSCSASACGYSMTAYDAHSGPGVLQDRDPSPHYDGWRTFFDRTAMGGAYRASRLVGQRMIFKTPVTRSVVWIAHRGRQEGRARVLIDGHPKGTFDLYAPVGSDRSFTFKGLSRKSHFVTIEVLGSKDAASRGRWVTVDAFNVGRNIRDESALTSLARLTLQFTGTRIDWLTVTGPAYGRARVVIDGVAHTVDLYRRRRHWRARIAYTRLGPGTHSITITPLGTKDASSSSTNVVFDAFIVH